jgi:hypothetical protein
MEQPVVKQFLTARTVTLPLCQKTIRGQLSRSSNVASGRFGFIFFQRVRTQVVDISYKGRHNFSNFGCFRRRHPCGSKAIGIDSKIFKDNLCYLLPSICLLITFQVMTFPEVSTNHQDAIGPFIEGAHHQVRTDHPRTHHPHYPQI